MAKIKSGSRSKKKSKIAKKKAKKPSVKGLRKKLGPKAVAGKTGRVKKVLGQRPREDVGA